VRLAHQMAMENPGKVIGEMVSANEFMDLSRQYNVYGVPKTVVNNGAVEVEGAMPEKLFLKKLLEAV